MGVSNKRVSGKQVSDKRVSEKRVSNRRGGHAAPPRTLIFGALIIAGWLSLGFCPAAALARHTLQAPSPAPTSTPDQAAAQPQTEPAAQTPEAAPPDPSPISDPPPVPAAQPARRTPMATAIGASVIVGWLALSMWFIARRKLLNVSPLTGLEQNQPVLADWPLLLLGGMVVWLGQSLGAASAATLFRITSAQLDTLRGVGLFSLGAYTGGLLSACIALLVLPGLTRLVGVATSWRAWVAHIEAGVIAFLLIMPIVMATSWVAAQFAWLASKINHTKPPDPIAHRLLVKIADPGAPTGPDAPWWWLVVLGVVVGAPLVEEIIYRGFIQTGIRRGLQRREPAPDAEAPPLPRDRDPEAPLAFPRQSKMATVRPAWRAVMLTSLLFALVHTGDVSPEALVPLFVLGVGLGVLHERTRSVLACFVVHALFNAANIVQVL